MPGSMTQGDTISSLQTGQRTLSSQRRASTLPWASSSALSSLFIDIFLPQLSHSPRCPHGTMHTSASRRLHVQHLMGPDIWCGSSGVGSFWRLLVRLASVGVPVRARGGNVAGAQEACGAMSVVVDGSEARTGMGLNRLPLAALFEPSM